MKKIYRRLVFCFLCGSVFILTSLIGACSSHSQKEDLEVPSPAADGRDKDSKSKISYAVSDLYDKTIGDMFSGGIYNSVLVGRYLDEEPARQLADKFKQRGLTAYVVQRTVKEKKILKDRPVGNFYLTMVGLLGLKSEAEILGERLRIEGLVKDYRVVPIDSLAEIEQSAAAARAQQAKAANTTEKAKEVASRPLSANSPAASGAAFKQNVYGRYIGSFQDPLKAQAEADTLTSSGWPASVKTEKSGTQIWYRVYLAETSDHREWKADPKVLSQAQKSAASQPGIIIMADMSSMAGNPNFITPNASRTDASACAGFSRVGRVSAAISRTINYIPDSSYTAALIPINHEPLETWRDIPGRIKRWWKDKPAATKKTSLYGPAIFNRPSMEAAVGKLKADDGRASMAIALTEVGRELSSIPGRKVLLVFSDFRNGDRPSDVETALDRLKAAYGSSLTVLFIAGDSDADGYVVAKNLSSMAGEQLWDCCMLLNDNRYFERFIKTIFR